MLHPASGEIGKKAGNKPCGKDGIILEITLIKKTILAEYRMKPEVSIVLSTYNRAERYLPRAIESVLAQTFKNWELLVMDDGSTDDTEKVVKKFKDSRIKYIKLDHFGCDTRPKNEGIKQAQADLIAFLDDDCAYRPDHLQALLRELTQDDGAVVLVYGDRWVTFEDEDKKPQIGVYSDFDYQLLMKQNYIDTSDVLVKKEVLYEVGGWDENLKKFVDWNLWVRLAKRGYQFKRLPIILTDYTIHKQMKSVTNQEGQYDPETGLFTPTFDPYNCKINVGFLGKPKKLKVALYTLCYNRLDYTKLSFETLRKTAGYKFDHYVVDQGSDDGTVEWLKKEEKAGRIKKVIYNKKNMGIPHASNQILEEIMKKDYDIIGKVDNDMVHKSLGWLEAAIGIYEIFRPINLSPYIEGLIHNPGGVHRYNYLYMGDEFLGLTQHIGGAVSLVPREVHEEFKWPKVAFLHGGNDVLLSSFLNNNNYLLAYMENYKSEHLQDQKEKYPEYFKNRDQLTLTRTTEFLKTGKLYDKSSRSYKTAIDHDPNG